MSPTQSTEADESTDESPDIIVDGQFTPEGLTVSVYDDDGNVLDETWFTWDEVEDRRSPDFSDFTFELQTD
jgi:hypothetical protein